MDDRDQLIEAIAEFIARYRAAGGVPARTMESVLAEFGAANSGDFAKGLLEANRAERGRHAPGVAR